MSDPLYCVVNARGEAISKALPKTTAQAFLWEVVRENAGTQAHVVLASEAKAEQRMVHELSVEQAKLTGKVPACFQPREGVRFELHTILPVEL